MSIKCFKHSISIYSSACLAHSQQKLFCSTTMLLLAAGSSHGSATRKESFYRVPRAPVQIILNSLYFPALLSNKNNIILSQSPFLFSSFFRSLHNTLIMQCPAFFQFLLDNRRVLNSVVVAVPLRRKKSCKQDSNSSSQCNKYRAHSSQQ